MALDVKKRLGNLQNRRRPDDLNELAKALGFAQKKERYQERSTADATQYALGAMEQVDQEYTSKSIAEGERVRNQLQAGLQARDIPVSFEYQGSVPLNVHIRGHSDVDLLVLHEGFFTADWSGPKNSTYINLGGTAIEDVQTLRSSCEDILSSKFPEAKVDKAGAKSVTISGGSLRRKVDVVPSCWHNTAEYQRTDQKHHREVKVLDKDVPMLVTNRPFLHMKMIHDKDIITGGGAKKAIRLVKTLRADSDRDISLSSYDIASIVWHIRDDRLRVPWYSELGLVATTLEAFKELSGNRAHAESLITPDGSRKIVDDPSKFTSIQQLTSDLEELAIEIAREINAAYYFTSPDIRRVLEGAYV